MRPTFLCMGAFAMGLLAAGCGKKEEGGAGTGTGDPRLDGAYTLLHTEIGGQVSKETEPNGTYTIEGDKFIPPKGKKENAETITCDPNKTPAEITFAKKELNGKVDYTYGVYKLEGDILTLCLVRSDNPADRPKEFKTSQGGKAILLVLKKV